MLSCNICESIVLQNLGRTDSLYEERPFIDPYGNLHNHSDKYVRDTYVCDKGHAFNVQILNSCHCGWEQSRKG